VSERFDLGILQNRLLHGAPSNLQPDLPIASVAVIINAEDRGGSVLLIKRTERGGDPWSGQIGFPGGHRSLADSSFLHTALRESDEEVGIELSERELLGSLPFVTTRSRRVQVAPFIFQLNSSVPVRMNREVAESFWVPLNELARLEIERREVAVEEGKLEVDCYDYGGRVIWGLTFRILNILLGRRAGDEL